MSRTARGCWCIVAFWSARFVVLMQTKYWKYIQLDNVQCPMRNRKCLCFEIIVWVGRWLHGCIILLHINHISYLSLVKILSAIIQPSQPSSGNLAWPAPAPSKRFSISFTAFWTAQYSLPTCISQPQNLDIQLYMWISNAIQEPESLFPFPFKVI